MERGVWKRIMWEMRRKGLRKVDWRVRKREA